MNTFNRNLDHLPLGVRSRLETLLSRTGGRLAVLPIDQGLEHGPIDFLDSPEAADPEHQFRLAAEAGFSGIAAHLGLAEKYLPDHAGQVPLILKLNGKTGIPPDEEAFSPLTAGVEDALRLNAQAVGYTLYVGSPAQDRDIAQFQRVRAEAGRYGLPVIVWAYPRGRWVDQVVDLAGRALVIVSGGARLSEDAAVAQARLALEAGAAGLIFGRNVWQRPFPRALELSRRLLEWIKGWN